MLSLLIIFASDYHLYYSKTGMHQISMKNLLKYNILPNVEEEIYTEVKVDVTEH